MDIAAIKNNVVADVYVFDEMQTAEQFFRDGAFGDVDMVFALPEGYGIGDQYKDGEWIKNEPPAPDPVDPPPMDEITALQIAVTELYEMMMGGGSLG